MKNTNVVVIGAGPAGIACAGQLKRQGIDFSLIESGPVGGLVRNANLVENYPGFPRGIEGRKLVRLLERYLQNMAIPLLEETVKSVSYDGGYIVETDRKEYSPDIVVMATGTKPVELPLPLSDDIRKKIHYQVADIQGVQGNKISIVGGGDAAFDYALNLVSHQNEVIVNIRGRRFRCLPLLAERASRQQGIKIRYNCLLSSVELVQNRLVLHWQHSTDLVRESPDYLLVAIGRTPNLDCLSRGMESIMPDLQARKRLFLVGDLVNKSYRQASIAVGDGVRVAMQIAEYMKGKNAI